MVTGSGEIFMKIHKSFILEKFGEGVELKKGMVFTIEPMLNEGKADLKILPDKWTAVTQDGLASAQFEHTVAVLDNGYEVLTRLNGQTDF